MSLAFETHVRVRFAHCDPAGIVFFPRFFEMLNQAVEDFFAGPLETPFDRLHGEMGAGIPSVHIETTFERPARLWDDLTFAIRVRDLGRSKAVLDVRAHRGGEVCVRFRQTVVFVTLEPFAATPWPADLRARLARYLIEDAASV